MVLKATYRQWLSCMLALTVSFIYGCKVGWTSATTTLFLSEESPIAATSNDVSWMISVSYTGTIFSVLLCYTLGDRFGRKQFILGCTLFYALAWTLILFTSSITVIIICFFLYGIACSTLYVICTVYIGEVANPKNRELIGASFSLATAIGIEVEYLMTSFDSYRWLALFPLLVSVFALLASGLMIESPYFLVSSGREEQALRNLAYLNDKDDGESMADLETVRKYVDEQKSDRAARHDGVEVMLRPPNVRLTLILVVVNGVSIMNCGCVITQTGSLMVNSFESAVNANLFVNTYSSLRVVFAFCSVGTVKTFERRTLFLAGYVATGLLQLVCGLCYYVESLNGDAIDWLAWAIAGLLIAFLVVYSLTFAVALEVLKIEIFPHRLKEFYSSVLAFTSDCFAFAVVKSYFYAQPIFGNAFLMVVYATISFVGAAVVYFFVQDTKGKTLQQIRTDLNGDSRGLARR